MPTDYSQTPLLKKLGIKPHFRCCFVQAPNFFFDLLGELPEGSTLHAPTSTSDLDYLHLFAKSDAEFDHHFSSLLQSMKATGMIWVSWYKKSSGISTDLNGNIIRGTARNLGLIDAKVCSINEDWSALKLVIPKENRKEIANGK